MFLMRLFLLLLRCIIHTSLRDGKRCNDCKLLMRKTRRYTDIFYFAQEISKILIDQDYGDLEKYKSAAESDTKNKGIYELLISEIYYQQGNKEKAKEYANSDQNTVLSHYTTGKTPFLMSDIVNIVCWNNCIA